MQLHDNDCPICPDTDTFDTGPARIRSQPVAATEILCRNERPSSVRWGHITRKSTDWAQRHEAGFSDVGPARLRELVSGSDAAGVFAVAAWLQMSVQ
jgi:hypothetical protein